MKNPFKKPYFLTMFEKELAKKPEKPSPYVLVF